MSVRGWVGPRTVAFEGRNDKPGVAPGRRFSRNPQRQATVTGGLIHIGTREDESPYRLEVPVSDGDMQRRIPVRIGSVELCTCIEEEIQGIAVEHARLDQPDQRRLCIERRALVDEHARDLRAPVLERNVERRLSGGVRRPDVRAVAGELPRDRDATGARGDVHRRVAVRIGQIEVAFPVDVTRDLVDVSDLDRPVQIHRRRGRFRAASKRQRCCQNQSRNVVLHDACAPDLRQRGRLLRSAAETPQRAYGLPQPACRANVNAMIWKLLLTAAVVFGAYLVIRARIMRSREAAGLVAPRPPLIPPALIRPLAYVLLGIMLIGSLSLLVRDWDRDREIIPVQVVNANTGEVTHYEVRRGSVDGRRFVTSDGREIRIADVERLVMGTDR
ncbi:hypothetical protein SAMN05421783_10395 [Thiocapsa roseopersicina]|uniref:Uncharacterized protein n=1 Tax=Thiocapsa roseopersicina TaxID=1058 RepID=A0A1H2SQS7_THIRO|nr:hypothetical protein SAMN05421783_10395 [Thiocapsa roseopersicina]